MYKCFNCLTEKADMPIDKKIKLRNSIFEFTPLETDVTLNWRRCVFQVTYFMHIKQGTIKNHSVRKKSSQCD